MLARHVRNRRLYDAIDQWAFCSLQTVRLTRRSVQTKPSTSQPVLGIGAAPASAEMIHVDHDEVKTVSTKKADFGDSTHRWGSRPDQPKSTGTHQHT